MHQNSREKNRYNIFQKSVATRKRHYYALQKRQNISNGKSVIWTFRYMQ